MPTSTNTKVKNLRQKRETMKTQAPRRRKSSRKHVLPANLTDEGEWASGPAPQVKTSRMFLGMLALHLVAVGGLVAFHFYGHDPVESAPAKTATATPASATSTPAKDKSTPPPARSVPLARTAPVAPTAPAATEYFVRLDETWESIAAARGISVDDLKAANPNMEIYVGRRLQIPSAPRLITAIPEARPSLPTTTIQAPDSVGSAYKHYAPNPEIAGNNVPPPTKATNTTIGGPVKANATAPTTSKTTQSSKPVATGKTYTIGKGDTLFAIAKRRGLTEKALMKYNGITDASKLRVGQKIKLPSAD